MPLKIIFEIHELERDSVGAFFASTASYGKTYNDLRGKRISDLRLTAKWADLSEIDFLDIKALQLNISHFTRSLSLLMLMIFGT